MSSPQFHGTRGTFSANKALDAIGESLAAIREQDGLHWKDVGRVLGKSDDRAAAYASGHGDMGVVSFLLACREWNGRFAGDVLAMIGFKLAPITKGQGSDRHFATALAKLQAKVNEALENDEDIDETELDGMRALLDEVGRGVDARRSLRVVRG
jgi:hypothetical protein